jgi:membrane peptidoglycan carboxypeptidase
MEGASGNHFKVIFLTLPWAVLRFFGRIIRRFFVVLGVVAALAVLGYVKFESIVETIDARYSNEIDAYLGIDRSAIARLHDRAYFAQQSMLVTEDLKTVACISSPEHRILIDDVADIPPLFVSAILASEDRNFFTHQGLDKGAIVRALPSASFREPLRGIDAHDADRQASSRRHRPCVDRGGKGRRHRHGAAD